MKLIVLASELRTPVNKGHIEMDLTGYQLINSAKFKFLSVLDIAQLNAIQDALFLRLKHHEQ